MDVGAVNQSVQTSSNAIVHKNIDAPVVKKSEVEAQQVKIPAVDNVEIKVTEESRKKFIKNIAQRVFKDVYVVSDQSFSIFKDVTGQYITRVTNYRDGSVTYIPEQNLLKQAETMGVDTSRLHLKV